MMAVAVVAIVSVVLMVGSKTHPHAGVALTPVVCPCVGTDDCLSVHGGDIRHGGCRAGAQSHAP